jgi:hypothetical protein
MIAPYPSPGKGQAAGLQAAETAGKQPVEGMFRQLYEIPVGFCFFVSQGIKIRRFSPESSQSGRFDF